jgi:hypothetical protein
VLPGGGEDLSQDIVDRVGRHAADGVGGQRTGMSGDQRFEPRLAA